MTLYPRAPWLNTLESTHRDRWVAAARRGELSPPLKPEHRTRLGTFLTPIDDSAAPYLDDPASESAEIVWDDQWRALPFARLRPALIPDLPWAFEQVIGDPEAERWDPHDRMHLEPGDYWLDGPYGEWEDPGCYDGDVFTDQLKWEQDESGRAVLSINEVLKIHASWAEWDRHSDPEDDDLFQAFRQLTGWLLYDDERGCILYEPIQCRDCKHVFEFIHEFDSDPTESPPACPECGGSDLALAAPPRAASSIKRLTSWIA